MGSSTSKAARRLPTPSSSLGGNASKSVKPDWAAPKPSSGRGNSIGASTARVDSGKGKSKAGFDYSSPSSSASGGRLRGTGEKDDAIKRDAMDPQFMSNLSKLGQVSIHDAGKFIPNPVAAQRTLNSRLDEYTNPNLLPPPNHLTAPLLSSLLDHLKTLPPGSDPSQVYEEYGMEKSRMDGLRRWVNSPSIKGDDEVVVVEGMQIVEMKAVWVDSADARPKQIA